MAKLAGYDSWDAYENAIKEDKKKGKREDIKGSLIVIGTLAILFIVFAWHQSYQNTSKNLQYAKMEYNEIRTILLDDNYQPIQSKSISESKYGSIEISKKEIKIGDDKTFQRFTVTKHIELNDKHEFSTLDKDKNLWTFSLGRIDGKGVLVAIWTEEKIAMVMSINSGFTLNIP